MQFSHTRGTTDELEVQWTKRATGEREKAKGAFHSTKNSGMKFRVFHVTNGTVFSGWFEPSRPSPSRTNFRAKIRNKQGNQKMADSSSILLALELLDDYEVEISEVLEEDDDITLFSNIIRFT